MLRATDSCACGYASNLERARSRIPEVRDEPAHGEPRPVHTPGRKTIAEIADFLQVPPTHQIKSLVYIVADRPCLFLVRGDHQLNESKLMAAVQSVPPDVRLQARGLGAGRCAGA